MRDYFLDRDLIKDKEGNIYTILTNYNPYGYVFAYLKYVYTGKGLWKGYERVLKEYGVHNLIKLRQKFSFEPCYDVSFPVVMISEIREHLKPEEKMNEILNRLEDDDLELILLDFIEHNMVGYKNIGITGSLLAGIQHRDSDIDIVIYGEKEALDFIETFQGFDIDYNWIIEANINYGIDFADKLYDRKRRGIYKGKRFSILFVDDKPWRYCEHICINREKARIRAKIVGDYRSLVYPSTAYIDTIFDGPHIDYIISYEGLYSSLLFGEKEIIAEGRLMECDDVNILLIGDREIKGIVKPIL